MERILDRIGVDPTGLFTGDFMGVYTVGGGRFRVVDFFTT